MNKAIIGRGPRTGERWARMLGAARRGVAAMCMLSAICAVNCSSEFRDDSNVEAVEGITEALAKPSGTNGDTDYCTSSANPCVSGEGDCDGNAQCTGAGIVCVSNIGPNFGMSSAHDVCAPSHCANGVLDSSNAETGIDCGGPCGRCVEACTATAGSSAFCAGCLCSAGQGDCDGDIECAPGLVCGIQHGPKHGFSAVTDVCVPAHCTNGAADGGETAVDCGGPCGTCLLACTGTEGANDFCTGCLCASGQGDCDANSECAQGTTCATNYGPRFSAGLDTDVCVPAHCVNDQWDQALGETDIDCGGNSGCGTCLGACSGVSGGTSFCTTCRCSTGQGDCDANRECAPGLVCASNQGPRFGLSSSSDVCLPVQCTNDLQDGQETGVDCGGQCGPCLPPCTGTAGSETFCSSCRCTVAQGDCDYNRDCTADAVCQPNQGAAYGFTAGTDVCVARPSRTLSLVTPGENVGGMMVSPLDNPVFIGDSPLDGGALETAGRANAPTDAWVFNRHELFMTTTCYPGDTSCVRMTTRASVAAQNVWPQTAGSFSAPAFPFEVHGARLGTLPAMLELQKFSRTGVASTVTSVPVRLHPETLLVPVNVVVVVPDQNINADIHERMLGELDPDRFLALFDDVWNPGLVRSTQPDGLLDRVQGDWDVRTSSVPLSSSPGVTLSGVGFAVRPDDIFAQCGVQFRLGSVVRVNESDARRVNFEGDNFEIYCASSGSNFSMSAMSSWRTAAANAPLSQVSYGTFQPSGLTVIVSYYLDSPRCQVTALGLANGPSNIAAVAVGQPPAANGLLTLSHEIGHALGMSGVTGTCSGQLMCEQHQGWTPHIQGCELRNGALASPTPYNCVPVAGEPQASSNSCATVRADAANLGFTP